MAAFHFSTADYAERDRYSAWRDAFGQEIARLELEPLGDGPFHGEVKANRFPGLTVGSIASSANRFTRTRSLIPSDSDDVIVGLMLEGGGCARQQGGSDLMIRRGDAAVWSNAVVSDARYYTEVHYVGLAIPRSVLVPNLYNADRASMQIIPRETAILPMLFSYARLLLQDEVPADAKALAASHVHDLVALALGPSRDAAEAAGRGGLRAGRLRALKADIAARLTDRELNINTLAARHGLAPRTVRALFQDDGTTFADVVLNLRLVRVHRQLSDARFMARAISALVYDAGFGDLSYFNNAFKKRYGLTPSDVRANAAGR